MHRLTLEMPSDLARVFDALFYRFVEAREATTSGEFIMLEAASTEVGERRIATFDHPQSCSALAALCAASLHPGRRMPED